MRILNFSDSFTSATEPTIGVIEANALHTFSSDSAYVSYKGSAAAQGDIYLRTSDSKVRFFNGSDWVTVASQDASGNLVVDGNLTVNGTTTTLNTQTLDVEDVNITVNKGGDDTSANGAGLTVDRAGTDGSLVYDSTKTSKWKIGNLGSEVEVADVSSAQTFTNKTLTSPAISSPTGLVKADVGLSNVDNTSDATKNAAVATLTNKTLTAPVINSPTGLVKADVGLSNVDNTSDATKNAATATLTNKTLTSPVLTTPTIDIATFTDQSSAPSSPSAGKRKIYSKTNGKVYHLDPAGVERELGSGGTGINFVTGGDAEGGSIFATYKDSSSAIPGDGTGGVPTISSATTTSTNPLSGANSFLLTHPASNVQGEGWSYDFSIDNAYKAKVLKIEFDYIVNSGTFVSGSSGVDSDIEVYIYDVTNAQIIQPSSYKLLSNSSTIADHFSGTFQTASNSTSYRLIFHCATTSTASFVLKVDSVSVAPSQYVYGTPITDWQAWTPTGSWTTNTTYTGLKRRVGDEYEYQVKVATSGAPTSAALTITILETIDLAKMIQGGSSFENVGTGAANDSGTAYTLIVAGSSSNAVQLRYQSATSGASSQVTQAAPFTFGASDYVTAYFRVPIVGLSSSVQMSDQTDTRIVSFSGTKSGGSQAVTGSVTDITFASDKDTHGGWNGSAYVVRVPGDYIVSSTIYSVASVANVVVYKNGANFTGLLNSPANTYTSGTALLHNLVVGDTISVRAVANITIAGDPTIRLGISRVSGPSAIAATETVSAKYSNTAGTSVGTGNQTLTFPTKLWDSHGWFSSNTTYTPGISGKYSVNLKFSANSISGLSTCMLRILVNGTTVSEKGYALNYSTASPFTWNLDDDIQLNAGDAVTFQFQNGFGSSITSTSTVGHNSVAIKRVGN